MPRPGPDPTNDPEYEHIQRLDFATAAARIGTWEVDLKTNTVRWDGRCQELFGLSKDYYIPYGEAIKHIHPEDVAEVDAAVHKALSGADGGQYDMRYRTIGAGDGILRWVHFCGQAYFNDQKEPIRFGGIAHDITRSQEALQHARQTLAAQEAMFRNVTYSAPTGLWLSDEEGGLTYLNETLVEWTGMPHASLLGAGWADAIIEEDRAGAATIFLTAVAGRTHYDTQFRIRKGDGSITWCRAAGDPYYRADGTYAGYAGYCADIDELVRQREALKQSEERFRTIFEQAPMAIGLLRGRDMVVEIGNDAIFRVWGKTRAIIGQKLIDALPEIRGQMFIDILEGVYDSGRPFFGASVLARLERNGQLEDGYFNFVYMPLRSNGIVTGIMVLANEVTEQVLASKAVAESESLMRAAVELAELGTWSLDLESDQLSYSARMHDWLGLAPEEINLQNLFSLIDEEDRERVEKAVTKAIGQGADGLFDEEYTISHHITGYKMVMHAQGQTLTGEDGKVRKLLGTAQDITMQRQIQFALEQEIQKRTEQLDAMNEELQATNEELASTNEELSQTNESLHVSNADLQQFAHVASHDLKEPLRKIKTFLSRLELGSDGTHSTQNLVFLGKVNKSVDRMSSMIEGVLNYSRLNSSDQKMEKVDINSVISDVVQDLEVLIEQRKGTVTYHELPVIEGARILIHQLFYNLLINSLKFSRPEDPPVITITAVTALQRNNEFYKIVVGDNGIGFDDKNANNIFNTFTMLNPKDQYEGTGLGLSLCKKIVQRHHGSIEASGQVNGGARFSILLPVNQPFSVI